MKITTFLLVLFLALLNVTIATAEIQFNRFYKTNHLIVDAYSHMAIYGKYEELPNNWNSKNYLSSFSKAGEYCANLNADSYSDWRLPNEIESKLIYSANQKKNFIEPNTSLWVMAKAQDKLFNYETAHVEIAPKYKNHTPSTDDDGRAKYICVRGSIFEDDKEIQDVVYKNKNNQKETLPWLRKNYPGVWTSKDFIESTFFLVAKENTTAQYEWFLVNFKGSAEAQIASEKLFFLVTKQNTTAQYKWFLDNFSQYPEAKKAYENLFKLVAKENTIAQYKWFLDNISLCPEKDKVYENLIKLIGEKGSIADYQWLLTKPLTWHFKSKVHTQIYEMVNREGNVAGHQWFISTYPDTPDARLALKQIHILSFNIAKDIGTVDSLNDFILVYPYSSQLSEAESLAYELEKKEYSRLFKSNEKLARMLSIKAKLMKRKASETGNDMYLLILARMTRLLEEMFPEEHSTERHLENEEILNALRSVTDELKSIKYATNQIADNTSNLTSILSDQSRMMDNHFKNATSDRKMAEKYSKDHRQWERYLKKYES